MTGMMADRHSDDMKGLLQGLRNCFQYKQIIFFPSKRFLLPPDDLQELLPLAEFDEDLLKEALKHPDSTRSKILKESTVQALGLFYEVLLSFANGRQVVLICDQGNELSRALLPFFSSATEEELDTQRVETDKLTLLSGIKEWPLVFKRFESPLALDRLLPGSMAILTFPWDTVIKATELRKRKDHLLQNLCPVSFPSEDVLNHPRSLLFEGNRGGFLLTIPRPSNMKNFSITLQTGKGIFKEEASATAQSAGKAPRVERNWMTREEVATAIKKSKDSVDNYCRRGILEAIKVGREIRITKTSVQRYLELN